MTMKTTITARQARLIAQTLEALEALPLYADGQYLRVDLMDELFSDPIGSFTQEDGAWLFEIDDPVLKPATPEEVAKVLFDADPDYYRERKIGFIRDLRSKWTEVTTETMSLRDAKDTVEKILAADSLDRLREKLESEEPSPADDDRAYAEYRERQAERGTWFGAPGPMDEEPF